MPARAAVPGISPQPDEIPSIEWSPDSLYRLLVESVTDYAIFVLDPLGRIRTWNAGAERLKGYTAEEIIGRHIATFYSSGDVAAGVPQRALATAAAEGRFEGEGWRMRKDGSRFWALVVLTALYSDSGRLIGYAKVTRDLTDRVRSEEAARQLAAEQAAHDEASRSEQLVRAVLESITDPFVVYDSQWRIRYFNSAARSVFSDVEPESLIGSVLWEAYPQWASTELRRQMQVAAEQRTAAEFSAQVPDTGAWLEIHCFPMPDGGLTVSWKDVTAPRQAQETLQFIAGATAVLASSLDYESTLNSLAELAVPRIGDWCGIDIIAEDGTVKRLAVQHVDPAKVELARTINERYPLDPEATGGVPHVLRSGEPEVYADVTEDLILGAARDDEHLRLIRSLGLTSILIVPLKIRDRVLGAITFAAAQPGRRYGDADLSLAMELADRAALAVENARLYRSAVEAQGLAETANRAKSEFLAVMSHELRTPLNAIAGYVQLLEMGLRGPITDEQRRDLQRVQRSQRHLLSLINDILNYARLEAGHVDYDIGPAAVSKIMRDIEPLVMPLIEGKGLAYWVESIPAELQANVDEEKVQQILLNLISNAVKFTERGGSIRIATTASTTDVHIAVSDTGRGIPPDKFEVIFTPFLQLERSLSATVEGTGLGLAISRDLARGLGGELRVESEVGKGSTFTLTLPLAEGHLPPS